MGEFNISQFLGFLQNMKDRKANAPIMDAERKAALQDVQNKQLIQQYIADALRTNPASLSALVPGTAEGLNQGLVKQQTRTSELAGANQAADTANRVEMTKLVAPQGAAELNKTKGETQNTASRLAAFLGQIQQEHADKVIADSQLSNMGLGSTITAPYVNEANRFKQTAEHNTAQLEQQGKLGTAEIAGRALSTGGIQPTFFDPKTKQPTPNVNYQNTQSLFNKTMGISDVSATPPEPNKDAKLVDAFGNFVQAKNQSGGNLGTARGADPANEVGAPAPAGPSLMDSATNVIMKKLLQFSGAIPWGSTAAPVAPTAQPAARSQQPNSPGVIEQIGGGINAAGRGIKQGAGWLQKQPLMPNFGPPTTNAPVTPLSQYVSPEVQNNSQGVEQLIKALLQQLRYS